MSLGYMFCLGILVFIDYINNINILKNFCEDCRVLNNEVIFVCFFKVWSFKLLIMGILKYECMKYILYIELV